MSDELSALFERAAKLFDRNGHHRNPLRGQGRILRTLALRGCLNQRELQDLFGMRSASVSELLLKLERKGLVQRTRSPEDMRSFQVCLTNDGQNMAEENRGENELFAVLDTEETTEFKRLLQKLVSSWEKEIPFTRGGGHGGHRRGCNRRQGGL